MNKKPIILQASARAQGDTYQAVRELRTLLDCASIDLLDHRIHPYDYEHRHDDDYLPLMRRLVAEYDCFIFATPVYWYSMSAQLKIFLDRFTDCLKVDKPTGRQLRGKSMALISVSNSENCNDDFATPLKLSAGYLGMHFLGSRHIRVVDNGVTPASKEELRNFSEELQTANR